MFIEFNYHSTFTDELDGVSGSGLGGIFTDRYETYLDAKIGWNYYYDKGTLSRKCALPGGISELVLPEPEKVDYDKIEELIKSNIPRVITREVVVEKEPEKPAPRAIKKSWVLEGVNFRSGSANLTNESYPILYDAVEVLKSNPAAKVEIQGHTDSSGGAAFNLTLSERRAQAVRDFLVANGISASRLFVKGYGESQPMADNYTSAGMAMNRRIEFKVIE
ncbi:MAG: OmpA family protein [Bacteroidetes bacterium]|nr:OmpA family protein [Bacteroidota bacterium]